MKRILTIFMIMVLIVGTMTACGINLTNSSLVDEEPEKQSSEIKIADNQTYRTETFARLNIDIPSSWDSKLSDDGRMLYLPAVEEYTGFIQCTFTEDSIGNVNEEEAKLLLDGAIGGLVSMLQEKTGNTEVKSTTYLKYGNQYGARVCCYTDIKDNDINDDTQMVSDVVIILFADGYTHVGALFTPTEYENTYKIEIEKALASIVPAIVEAEITSEEVIVTESANSPIFDGYRLIEVDGGDISGHREANVVVDIGFGDREYWAFTNEHGQLVKVIADVIIPQDANKEPVTSDGRYYPDEAKVPGTESSDLDEGHVIADSLGGVANAYNITPQDSTLNRYGDQAYMEKVIRDAGGCTDFVAIITYPDTKTQIPSHYSFKYTLMGNVINDEFDNVNPDEANASLNNPKEDTVTTTNSNTPTVTFDEAAELKRIDTNQNGQVTIAEAKNAGFAMPIYKDHWLYKYMKDGDGDGQVGE